MSDSCDCCVLLGEGPCDGPITRPEEPYRVWCVCYFETSIGRPEPNMAVEAREGGGGTPMRTSLHFNST